MSFPYKHILVIGATSGIGKAMADTFIEQGIHVTAVGRREDRLSNFVATHGSQKASSLVFDVSEIDKIPAFADTALKKYPTIDAIFLNAGIQRRYNFADPVTVDLSMFNKEMTVNFTSFVALTHAFLPHLLSSSKPAAVIFTGTHISLVPAATISAYSASKAALDAFMLCIRQELHETNVSVVHISPPLVQTEIHDAEMGSEVGRKMGMPVVQFAEETWASLKEGKKDIYVGSIGASTKEQLMEIVDGRMAAFNRLCELMKKISAMANKS